MKTYLNAESIGDDFYCCLLYTSSTCLLAGTGAGKSSVDKPIRYMMEDIRKRDAENLKREKEWKEEVTRKGANKDKRKRPDNRCV